MTRADKIEFFRIALALQQIGVTSETSDRLIETIEAIEKKGGKFTIDDAVEIQIAMDRKYAKNTLVTNRPE